MWIAKLPPAALFAGSLTLFVCTLAPAVTFVDSGELIVAANNLGVAHPPGFPLYLLISHAATRVPLGSVAQRVHFVSALCAAVAVVLLYLVTMEALRFPRSRAQAATARKTKPGTPRGALPRQYECIAAGTAAALVACSRTLWSYATVAEVYTMNAALILLVLLLLFRWRRRAAGPGAGAEGKGAKPGAAGALSRTGGNGDAPAPVLAAFVFGMALGVHHMTVALTLPAILWLVWSTQGTGFLRSRRFGLAVLAGLAGLCIYAYLPWAAARSPVLNWGDPDTPERFWRHVSGMQYQSNFSLSPDQALRQIGSFFQLLFVEFGRPWLPAGLALAFAGFWRLFTKDRILLVFLILAVCCNLIFTAGYDIAEDKDAYAIPVFLVVALAAGLGARALLASVREPKRPVLSALLLLVPVLSLAAHVRANDRREFHVAEDYVQNILRGVDRGGLLLTADWQVASPMLYLQEIGRQRPDVICIDVLLLRRSWYLDYLESRCPGLMRRSREEVRLFMEDLARWEADPGAFRRDAERTRRIDDRFCAMIAAFVADHLGGGPVYATSDVVLSPGGENRSLADALLREYRIVPQGLVFRLPARGEAPGPALPALNMRGLVPRAPAVDADPVVRQKVLPAYATMLVNCGRAYAAQGDPERSMEAYRQAWAVDSAYVRERNLLPRGVAF